VYQRTAFTEVVATARGSLTSPVHFVDAAPPQPRWRSSIPSILGLKALPRIWRRDSFAAGTFLRCCCCCLVIALFATFLPACDTLPGLHPPRRIAAASLLHRRELIIECADDRVARAGDFRPSTTPAHAVVDDLFARGRRSETSA
jgi:hypothetical protein